MRKYLLALMLILSCEFVTGAATPVVPGLSDIGVEPEGGAADGDMRTKIQSLNIPFTPKYTRELKSKIDDYIRIYRKKTSRMLGLTSIYFPIIEEYLKASGIPDVFKYLPIIETDLNPRAVSPDGAVGIWQFMPSTGAIYGLSSDKFVDQRCDIHRSTEAAAKYLKKLYDIYGDWALVLAAYNCGPGRVNSAIKKGLSNNYWVIEKYLPEQTRNYIPNFIATAYAMQYFPEYGITADNPDLDLQLTKEMKVYKELTFDEISLVTGLDVSQIAILNPQYLRNFIPASTDGNFLTLPKRIINAFNHFVSLPDNRKNDYLKVVPIINEERDLNTSFYHKTNIIAGSGESLKDIAEQYDISVHSLVVWNNITELTLASGTEVAVYLPKKTEVKITEVPQSRKLKSFKLTSRQVDQPLIGDAILDLKHYVNFAPTEYVTYIMLPEESLQDIATKYGVTIQDLITLNQFDDEWTPKPGMIIRIKESEIIKP